MDLVLKVENLSKKYAKFELKDVSFEIECGSIMGFIGRNGAGKTTTLKCLLNLVHTDGGKIEYFGLDYRSHENEIKQRIGFSSGGVDYYPMITLKKIASVTKSFYDNWNENAYERFMKEFSLDENKKVKELSEGMKVKFNLTLALSHNAELLILDEPTSGLDPVSRDELLTIFENLSKEGVSILFSTHITSDLDKCADHITYIKNGIIVESLPKTEFLQKLGGGNLEDIMLRIEKGAY